MTRLVYVLVMLLVVSGLPVSAVRSAEAKACPADKPPILFGAAVSLTGSLSREGGDTQKGYDVWADWINKEYGGIKVGNDRYCAQIKYYDDESKAETVSVLTEKLITEDNAKFILGP